MTNEEAIDLLSMIEFEHSECCLNTWYKGIDDDMKEALDMAIQALEQQPCDDAISRQAVLDVIAANCIWENEYNLTSSRIKNAVEQLPSVSTEKIGHWEKLSVGYGCSECSLCTNIHGTQDFKYCPNCGAKMEGEE